VQSQFTKLTHYHHTRGEIRWKHAMHLIRLLLSGITALRERVIRVRVDEYRDHLLAIRHGKLPWDEVDAWRRDLHAQLDAAFAETKLPPHPDYKRADAFLIKARRSMVT
jgi:hypothetical protein